MAEAYRRHDLLDVEPGTWRAVTADRADLAGVPHVAAWIENGHPLILRRSHPGEEPGRVPVGLPLPPRDGKRRAPAEAAAGFPSLYRVGLPALRRGRQARPGDAEAARVEACLALVAHVEDTNLLHRGGPAGFAFARAEAARFIAEGGVAQPDWRERAEALHRAFVARNLSPGGAADLLAMTLFVDGIERDGMERDGMEGRP
ncbi:hypothetical protein MRSR164_04535 [Methylobacterium radiotolerans]|uniref:triphosphoribosyl-dephospho-CoA synthase n=1 Tax=Methylobacterium radiotolerans TaxID=31998 RepID=A0ABU7T6B2_9HYPH